MTPSLSLLSLSLSKFVSPLGPQASALDLKILYTHYPLRSVGKRSPPVLQMRKLGVREMK